MRTILIIAWREVSRFTRQFRGGVSPLAVVVLLVALGLSALALRETAVLGNGLYRIGVSEDAPALHDSRFVAVPASPAEGAELLSAGAIDVYIDGSQVIAREDDKSQVAVGALKRYLVQQELRRIGASYAPDQAFPVQVEIVYLERGEAASQQSDLSSAPVEQTVIPSLMQPTAPFGKVILALLYILPVSFISVFFTSSFMEEKINRRLTILMSTPVSPFQIIAGKMLPYATIALVSTAFIASVTQGEVLKAVAIFAPAITFLFAIYLMVPLFYRTFKDITFISMLVSTTTTAYLVFPAMFTGLSDLAFMSPLTLAVKMYNGEAFGWREYLFPSLPMVAIFALAVYVGSRLLNEEFLMGYRPITRKMGEAIYLALDREHPYLSIFLLSLMIIPIVYMMQLVVLVIASNLPFRLILIVILVGAVFIEEIAKSVGIVTLYRSGVIHSTRQILALSFLSGLGFLIGEKALVFVSVSFVSESAFSGVLFSSGLLLVVPLLAHFFFTSIVTLLTTKGRLRYLLALLIAAVLHSIYNYILTGGLH
jgi:ABC-type Na+ efflux pump permease subunit